ncbi:BgTH12-00636 [Blumeria graminis f. sp. triticale]|uniref:BgTH12-00636 n=1 Tax=Blumeria graminis f. sp. triticale TaxID=1689686 RepID=A0A9W4D6T4_BLUGR|nr:BgTH12-00636 [Blumeria graminis f. sp. triticale]
MHCFYAVLTFSFKYIFQNDRLVIVSGGSEPFYGVYKPPSHGEFPMPKLRNDQVMSHGKVSLFGMYMAAYCSEKLPLNEMLYLVTKELEPMPTALQESFFDIAQAEDKCLKSIYSLSNKSATGDKLKLSEIMKRKECSIEVIVSVAFKQKISLLGINRGLFPSGIHGMINIEVDRVIEFWRLILTGRVVRGQTKESKSKALAWFRGQLHLFQNDERTRSWHPLTNLEPSHQNGALIASFLQESLGVDLALKNRIEALRRKEDILLEKLRKDGTLDSAPHDLQGKSEAVVHIAVELLSTSNAFGSIGAAEIELPKLGPERMGHNLGTRPEYVV